MFLLFLCVFFSLILMIELFSADGWLNQAIVSVNYFTWTYILVAGLVICALWFTWRTRFVQFRMIGEMVRLLGDSTGTHDEGEKHVSSFKLLPSQLPHV